jgi:hypothetical protein
MARTTSSVKHTHQYYRERVTGLWHCSGIDGCTHYMPKNMPAPIGRTSICWSCEKEFQLNPMNMVDDKPICDKCTDELNMLADFVPGQSNE